MLVYIGLYAWVSHILIDNNFFSLVVFELEKTWDAWSFFPNLCKTSSLRPGPERPYFIIKGGSFIWEKKKATPIFLLSIYWFGDDNSMIDSVSSYIVIGSTIKISFWSEIEINLNNYYGYLICHRFLVPYYITSTNIYDILNNFLLKFNKYILIQNYNYLFYLFTF